jgi:hypothetical protein
VSYQIFIQRFDHGEPTPMASVHFEDVFRPFIDRRESAFSLWHLQAADGGSANIYASTEPELICVMISHFDLGAVLDLAVEFAHRADGVFLLPGCPTALTRHTQHDHLPVELAGDAVLVHVGADIERLFQLDSQA